MDFYPAFHKCLYNAAPVEVFLLQDYILLFICCNSLLCSCTKTESKRELPGSYCQISKISANTFSVLKPVSSRSQRNPDFYLHNISVAVPFKHLTQRRTELLLGLQFHVCIYLEFANALYIVINKRNLGGTLVL